MKNRIKALFTALLILSVMAGTAVAELPVTFDWRDVDGTNYVTSVKDQGYCGACWAFAGIAAVESKILIEHPEITNADLSEQYFVSDCWSYGSCTSGTAITQPQMFFDIERYGVPIETCFPYLAQNSPCNRCDNWRSNAWYISSYTKIYPTESAYKYTIFEHGPITGALRSDQWYYPDTSHKPAILHAVLIIGWNDTEGCWIAKNSYGTVWGDDGYGKILYDDALLYERAYSVSGTCQGCVCDVTVDGFVNNDDVVQLLDHWGLCVGCPCDITDDGMVNNDDILEVILNWGPCS